MQMVHRVGGS